MRELYYLCEKILIVEMILNLSYIFIRFIERNTLQKYNIHFHGLRHTFSNMLFEMNENPKAIQ